MVIRGEWSSAARRTAAMERARATVGIGRFRFACLFYRTAAWRCARGRPIETLARRLVSLVMCLEILFFVWFFWSSRRDSRRRATSLASSPPRVELARVKLGSMRLELAGDLVLEGVELLDELLAGVLEEHVAVHEPGGVAEADELHHLGEDGDGVDGADDGAGEPDDAGGAGDVGDDGRLVLGVLPLRRSGGVGGAGGSARLEGRRTRVAKSEKKGWGTRALRRAIEGAEGRRPCAPCRRWS